MDKLEGIKPGDRVRVTFEGDVNEVADTWFDATIAGGDRIPVTFTRTDVKSPHFHIERIEKPLAVGDRVKDAVFGFGTGEILCVDGLMSFVRWDSGKYGPSSTPLSNLERIS